MTPLEVAGGVPGGYKAELLQSEQEIRKKCCWAQFSCHGDLGIPCFCHKKKIRIDKRKKDLPNANAYQTPILQFIYALEIPMRRVYYKMPHYNVSLAQLSHFLCYAYNTNSLTFLHFAITLKYPHHISTQDEKMRMVPHTYNTNNLETEAGESLQFKEQLELHTSLKAN